MIFRLRCGVRASVKANKKLTRQAEEGQAILLVGVFMLVMIALLGLVADLEISQLGKDSVSNAAQDAARAGAPYVYSGQAEADARAIAAVQSYGYKVGCFYRPELSYTDAYNRDCRRASWEMVKQAQPDQLYFFESQAVNEKGLIHYTVKIGKLQSRLFLGVLGFPDYPILQSATATFKPDPVKVKPPLPPTPATSGQPPANPTQKSTGLPSEEEITRLLNGTGWPGDAANRNGWPGNNLNRGEQVNGGTSFQPVCAGKAGCK